MVGCERHENVQKREKLTAELWKGEEGTNNNFVHYFFFWKTASKNWSRKRGDKLLNIEANKNEKKLNINFIFIAFLPFCSPLRFAWTEKGS